MGKLEGEESAGQGYWTHPFIRNTLVMLIYSHYSGINLRERWEMVRWSAWCSGKRRGELSVGGRSRHACYKVSSWVHWKPTHFPGNLFLCGLGVGRETGHLFSLEVGWGLPSLRLWEPSLCSCDRVIVVVWRRYLNQQEWITLHFPADLETLWFCNSKCREELNKEITSILFKW